MAKALATAGITGLAGLLGLSPEEAEAYLTKKMLREALKTGIDEFTPPGGANLNSGLYDRGEGAKGQNTLFSVLTGENPNATRLPDEQNRERTLQLGDYLIDTFGEDAVTLAKGMYDHPERSFIVEGQSPLEMAKIGRDYGQHSVFTDRGLVLTSGDDIGYMHPIIPQKNSVTGRDDYRGVINPEAENYYTEAQSSGRPEWGLPPKTEKIQYDIDWSNKIRIPDINAPMGTPASAKGIHYSTTPNLTELDPNYYGTGSPGAEKSRVDDGAPNRTMFYLGQPDLTPESIVRTKAPNKYEANLTGMYDRPTDPQGISEFSKNETEFEKNLQAMDYEGYLSQSMADESAKRTGSAVKFTPTALLVASSIANSQTMTPEQAKESGLSFGEYTEYKRMMDYINKDLGLDQPQQEVMPPSVGSIEGAKLPFMQSASDFLQGVELPWGKPFESTANSMGRWAYGESPDMIDRVIAPIEIATGASALLPNPKRAAAETTEQLMRRMAKNKGYGILAALGVM